MWEKLPHGKKRRRCRICRQLRAAKNRDVAASQPVVGGEVLIDHTVQDSKLLTPQDRATVMKFRTALDIIRPACLNRPGEYSDYEQDEAEDIPSPEYAEKLCAGCPVRQLCGAAAEVFPPAWGVRNGQVWAFGNKYNNGKYEGEK